MQNIYHICILITLALSCMIYLSHVIPNHLPKTHLKCWLKIQIMEFLFRFVYLLKKMWGGR